MKPHGKSVYAVLLLDNRGLRSFTVRVFWLKVLCFLFLLLFAAAGLGGYLAHKYRTQYSRSQETQRDTERQLAETRQKLEPLMHLEKIQETGRNRAVAESGIDAVSGADALSPAAGNATMTAQIPPAEDRHNATEAPPPETSPDTAHPAKITNMSLLASGSTQIRISFTLSNQSTLERQPALSGQITLAVLTNTGATAKITQVDHADLDFRIRRYKKVSTLFTLPPDIAVSDVAFVQVSLNGDNVPPYSERFPLQSL